MSDSEKHIALCYTPHNQQLLRFSPKHLEQFTNIDDYWMKRKGLLFYPFDRSKPAYFFSANGSSEFKGTHEPGRNLEMDRPEYETSVMLALKSMEEGSLAKVVLARNKIIERKQKAEDIFKEAINKYPEAFNYYVDLGIETWIGASPELLLKFEKDKVQTMALAGTRSLDEEFTEKEIDEQNMVEQFIESKLNLLQLPFSKSEKDVLVQGNIKHLKTDYEISAGSSLALELLKHLQPTSAVCGLPRDQSFEFIQSYETLNRSFYAGLTGVMEEDKALFYVNLRCMRFYDTSIEMFAGAGITIDSDPKKEWMETENKLALLEDLFR
jgi:isochorismate synthase